MLKNAAQHSQCANEGPTCKNLIAPTMCLGRVSSVMLAAPTLFATPRFALMPLSFGKKPKTVSSL